MDPYVLTALTLCGTIAVGALLMRWRAGLPVVVTPKMRSITGLSLMYLRGWAGALEPFLDEVPTACNYARAWHLTSLCPPAVEERVHLCHDTYTRTRRTLRDHIADTERFGDELCGAERVAFTANRCEAMEAAIRKFAERIPNP
jgi:hypothetical protein